jgi:hypothetical protein
MATEIDLLTLVAHEEKCLSALMHWIESGKKDKGVVEMLMWRREQAHDIALEAMRQAVQERSD